MPFPPNVRIQEVGPRDGLQNEPNIIPTDLKIELVNQLSNTGLKSIEVTSFVSPKKIPQLADASLVLQGIHQHPNIQYSALVPNTKGMEEAIKANVSHIAVFSTVSETFSQKNTQCSIQESIHRIEEILVMAKAHSISVRAYISCVLGCPYEGEIPFSKTVELATTLYHIGCSEIALGDTIGVGTPLKAKTLLSEVSKKIPMQHLAIHFHDTYGQALVNIYACLELGISIVDASIAGLGGCPYAQGATGNVATEKLLYMLNGLNIETGVDLQKINKVSAFVKENIFKKS